MSLATNEHLGVVEDGPEPKRRIVPVARQAGPDHDVERLVAHQGQQRVCKAFDQADLDIRVKWLEAKDGRGNTSAAARGPNPTATWPVRSPASCRTSCFAFSSSEWAARARA